MDTTARSQCTDAFDQCVPVHQKHLQRHALILIATSAMEVSLMELKNTPIKVINGAIGMVVPKRKNPKHYSIIWNRPVTSRNNHHYNRYNSLCNQPEENLHLDQYTGKRHWAGCPQMNFQKNPHSQSNSTLK
jgi:hypothetical protein